MTEQQNALLIFMEELVEVATEILVLHNQVSKAIRFGIDEQRDLPTSNRERIQAEWNDLLGAVQVLAENGVDLKPDLEAIRAKTAKIDKYTQYSIDLGQVRI